MSEIITTNDFEEYMLPKVLLPSLSKSVVNAMNAWVENHTNRCWGETKTITERYDWGKTLRLRKMDITAINSVKVGWPGQQQTTLDPSGYFFNVRGRVTMFWQALGYSSMSPLYNDYLEVNYTYGVKEVPEDLKLAVLGIAGGFYNFSINGQNDLTSTSVGSYKVQYGNRAKIPERKPETVTAEANWVIVDSYSMKRL